MKEIVKLIQSVEPWVARLTGENLLDSSKRYFRAFGYFPGGYSEILFYGFDGVEKERADRENIFSCVEGTY